MTDVQIKKLPNSQVELTVEVSSDTIQPFLEKAARDISKDQKIPGFRPGTAPLEIVRSTVGDTAVVERALQEVIPKTYVDTLLEHEDIEAIGRPSVETQETTIGKNWKYKATVAVIPEVTLGAYQEISEKKQVKEVTQEEVNTEIERLRKMRASYITVPRAAALGDQIRADISVQEGNVPLEAGQTTDQLIQLGEEHLVPDFEKQIIGMKEGDAKTFEVTFPERHHESNLQGKTVTFSVKVKEVQQRLLPELNDEFLKGLGDFKNVEDLRNKIKENMQQENNERERERIRQSLLDQIVKKTSFGDIPDVLIERELDTMMKELHQGVESMGLTMDQYLQQQKKTLDEMKNAMKDRAIDRVRFSLTLRTIAVTEKIEPEEEEIQKETQRLLERFPNPKEARKRIDPQELIEIAAGSVRNRKVFDRLETFAGVS